MSHSLAANFSDVLGVFGVILILLAYFLIQSGKMSHHSPGYSLINLIGAVLILYSLFYSWNLASFVIEIAWIAISIYGLVRSLKR